MVMITWMWAFAAVNHAGSPTLLPMLLARHYKYAIIYLRAAGGCGKTPDCKTTRVHALRFYIQSYTLHACSRAQ